MDPLAHALVPAAAVGIHRDLVRVAERERRARSLVPDRQRPSRRLSWSALRRSLRALEEPT